MLSLLILTALTSAQVPTDDMVGKDVDMGNGVTMRMHRVEAEVPVGDGWHQALSTLGGFAVLLPHPFNDLRSTASAKDGATIWNDTLGFRSTEGIQVAASCMTRSDGKSEVVLADLMAKVSQPGDTVSKVEVEGFEAMDVLRPAKVHGRFLVGQGRVCTLMIERVGEAPLPDDYWRSSVLNSFVVTGPVLSGR